MAVIDHQKVYDIIPKTCKIECTKMLKLSEKLINLITETVENKNVKLV